MEISPTDQVARNIVRDINRRGEKFWEAIRRDRPLKLFHLASKKIPAYRNFLKKNRINPEKIKTFEDFQLVPPVSKNNYLRQYSPEDLSWDGSLAKPLVWTATSGSTGHPVYFPRQHYLDWQYSILAELFIRNDSTNQKSVSPTLVIIGFGMGVWIGGIITYQAFEIAARRNNFPVSIITPGINKKEIFHALRHLSPHFSKTILVGYPPFIKDVLDEAESIEKIQLKKLNIRILTAAESYSEKFREYLSRKGHVSNIHLDTLNIYGTADMGAMAWETPISILIRRIALSRRKILKEIFNSAGKIPTLAQYNPYFLTFESVKGEVLLSGDSAIPLIRYAVGDHGGVSSFRDMVGVLENNGKNLDKEILNAHLPNIYKLPFVYVYERADFSTTLYGLQIYPETIKEALLSKQLSRYLTGKFTMLTKYNRKHDQYLELNLELKKGKFPGNRLKKIVSQTIISHLRLKNSEFRELSAYLGARAHPVIVFWPAEHPTYFKSGVKQGWVIKTNHEIT